MPLELDHDWILVINDPQREGLLKGPLSRAVPVGPVTVFRGDGEIIGIRQARDIGGGDLVPVASSGRTVRVFLGLADQAPTSGTHTFSVTKTASSATANVVVPHNATASSLQALLNTALATVIGPD